MYCTSNSAIKNGKEARILFITAVDMHVYQDWCVQLKYRFNDENVWQDISDWEKTNNPGVDSDRYF